jgi:hypothetical protein
MSERTLTGWRTPIERLIGAYFVAVAVSPLVATDALGQVVVPGGYSFEDDFEDGDIYDGIPAKWGTGAWSGATLSVEEGNVEINGCRSGYCAIAPRNSTNTSYLGYTDTIIRTQARITEVNDSGTRLGVFVRSTAPSGYFARIDQSGWVAVFEAGNAGVNFFGTVETDLDPVNNDVWMEFSIEGNQMAFRAWEDGMPIPDEPLISATDEDSTFPWGTFGLYVESVGSTPASGVFRWATVSDVPEPSSAGLFICAVMGCVSIGRRRSRKQFQKM